MLTDWCSIKVQELERLRGMNRLEEGAVLGADSCTGCMRPVLMQWGRTRGMGIDGQGIGESDSPARYLVTSPSATLNVIDLDPGDL
ncbi:hypothetical protein PR048_013592 [Dryococelus australis]|uniref:Uncharacterized protein n=1 Tax=Dryococelus australis TaxID=614101 RepID=A0ABQ9HT16_9NEOP|nr:hypothetical protein PR048_013592 [Dryococelus australis]